MTPPEIVTDQRTLEAYCHTWRQAGRFAFDTEFIRDDTYEAALCLIQVTTGDNVVLVDPAAGVDVAPFWALVSDPAVTTIVHAGKEDFDVCLRMTGQPPRNVFDVQIAAGFVGAGYPLSLMRLVDHFLHRRIAKGQTLTDWLRRPLTEEQLRYAVEDVVHLPKIHTMLVQRLDELGRLDWVREEFQRFEDPAFYRPPVQDRLFKLKGSKRLDPLGLAVLERLVAWREDWARQRNRPIRAMMRDDVLVEIARRRPKKPSELEVMRGFPQARNPRVISDIINITAETAATPRESWPEAFEPPDDSPMTKATLDFVSAVTRAICHDESLSHELVGTTQRLRDLLEHLQNGHAEGGVDAPPAGGAKRGRAASKPLTAAGDAGTAANHAPLLLRGWRRAFIGDRLVDLLQGRSELHLSGWPRNPRLEIVRHT